MNALLRSTSAIFVLSSLALVSCSGGVSVPPAGSAPSGGTVTATPTAASSGSATATPTGAPTGATTTPPAATPTPGATATPTSVATGGTNPTPTPTPTSVATTAGACPPSFPPEPAASMAAFPSAGGTIALPAFADQSGSVVIPSNSSSSGTKLTFTESQTTFTDTGGNGNITEPPSGYTAILFVASYLSPAQTITYGGTEMISVTAKAPCELPQGKSYYAFVYANGGGFNHSELSPTTGYAATQASDGSVSFTISLTGEGGLQPTGTGLEVVFTSKP